MARKTILKTTLAAILAAVGWRFCVGGKKISPERMAFLLDKPIAHRGLWNESAPENSLAAFERALKAGVSCECDIQRSKDGVLMVFHDDDLYRMTGMKGAIKDYTCQQLQTFSLNDTTQTIPTLDEVLTLIDGRVGLLIELKTGIENKTMAAQLVEQLADYSGEVAVQSFDPFLVAYFARHQPKRVRGILSGDFDKSHLPQYQRFLLKKLLFNALAQPNFIGYEAALLPTKTTAFLRKKGIPVLAWTIRTPKEALAAAQYCDNFIGEGALFEINNSLCEAVI